MIKLGAKAREKETGFNGVVTARAEYLYDRPRVLVESIDSTGRPIEWWYDESRLEVIEEDNKTSEHVDCNHDTNCNHEWKYVSTSSNPMEVNKFKEKFVCPICGETKEEEHPYITL